jgi:hypothetical protein
MRFDVLPLLVATDGAVAAFGRDVRRLRPNLVIAGVIGLDERTWPGSELHIGTAIVCLDSLRGRCPMTTVDPDTLARDPEVLRDIGRRFGGRLALNAWVVRSGVIHEGDAVALVPPKPLLGAKGDNRIDPRRAFRGHIAGHERDRDEHDRDADERDGVGRRQINEHGLENGRRQ